MGGSRGGVVVPKQAALSAAGRWGAVAVVDGQWGRGHVLAGAAQARPELPDAGVDDGGQRDKRQGGRTPGC